MNYGRRWVYRLLASYAKEVLMQAKCHDGPIQGIPKGPLREQAIIALRGVSSILEGEAKKTLTIYEKKEN